MPDLAHHCGRTWGKNDPLWHAQTGHEQGSTQLNVASSLHRHARCWAAHFHLVIIKSHASVWFRTNPHERLNKGSEHGRTDFGPLSGPNSKIIGLFEGCRSGLGSMRISAPAHGLLQTTVQPKS